MSGVEPSEILMFLPSFASSRLWLGRTFQTKCACITPTSHCTSGYYYYLSSSALSSLPLYHSSASEPSELVSALSYFPSQRSKNIFSTSHTTFPVISFMADIDNNPHDSVTSESKEKQDDTSPDRTSDVAVQKAPSQADTIPDGGLTAWLQVVGSFFLFFNSW